MQAIYGNSAADLEALERPEILEAVTLGSEPVLSETFSAHRAFANDMIAMNQDWSPLLDQREVPVKILCGTEDAGAPIQSVRECVAAFAHLQLRVFEGQGKLLPFTHWREIIEEIEAVGPG